MEAGGEEVVYEPRAARRPRTHVYRVRLDDQEMSKLQALAKRRGVTASVVLRELVRAARVVSGRPPRRRGYRDTPLEASRAMRSFTAPNLR